MTILLKYLYGINFVFYGECGVMEMGIENGDFESADGVLNGEYGEY